MKIVLIGATGHLGQQVLVQALAQGHHVTALLRDRSKLQQQADEWANNLQLVAGDARDQSAVAAALAQASGSEHGSDNDTEVVVISTIGPGSLSANLEVLPTSAHSVVAAMQAAGLRRLLWVAAAGLLDAGEGGLRRDSPGFPPMLRAISEAHLEAFETIKASSLDWTLLCPPSMNNSVASGRAITAANTMPPGQAVVALADAAAFLLAEAAAGGFVGQRVGINSP
jgi:uncharacterized protein